ncbi:PEP-CTERM sorting domain-containing protein [Microcystis aeruginosa BLCCF158]|uniref:PEP-CTERM sorting domain-containing protein n=2 Tax=Microcystis aeruginosa TaxID=1126 RepID=A0A841UYK2_MICAE|nr:PEP-CTERM sorting domain-containing protein [Microcystis aeruginosa BLCC-F158]
MKEQCMSLKTSVAVAATAIGLTTLAYPAEAAKFFFSYTHGGPTTPIVVTGTLTGDLGPGGIITINGFSDLTYNGVDLDSDPFEWQPGNTFVDSYSNQSTGSGVPATASFSGASMDFVLFGSGTATQYIAFGPAVGVVGDPTIFSSYLSDTITNPPLTNDLGGLEEPFNQSGWSLTAIPEPSAVVGLLGLGLGALASRVRKKG